MLEIAMNQINVPDLEKAIEWYTKKLGFEVSKDHYYPQQAVDLVQKSSIRLLLYKVEKTVVIDYPNVNQSVIIFKTKDLKETMKKMKEKGVELIYPDAIEFPAGLFNAIKDPFGNVHEIVQIK
ncbi:MAG: VOC family protein [Candidatus Heimdallarchaeota archaeon]|nr:VOC family protein [Candidatus Heimdallarchaeota archaeon]MCK4290938.1 VOC family protein [Candidatus Heimdallarchaeota archaeon]